MSSHNRPDEPLVGEVIGQRFAVKERLDATGLSDVYRAEHVLIHKDVALKVSRTGLDPGDQVVARFQRVARVATQLQHPNCIKINDFGLDDRGYVFLAMEYGTGRDLQRILDEDGPLSPDEIVTIGLQMLEGLGEAHRRGILHTELQPKYVMVDQSTGTPEVKLLGFGLGGLMKGIEEGTAASGMMRPDAAAFAAPELLRPTTVADHRADLFAAGAVLYTALVGRLPWPGAADDPTRRLDQEPPRASQVRKDGSVTMGLDRALARALEPDPRRRFSDAAEMAAALQRALHEDPDEASTVAPVHHTFGRYKLLRTIAQGGMGELHLAVAETLPGLTKVCALKRLRAELAAEKSYVDRFLQEARLAASLSHPNLATVYDVGKADEHFYMAMEYIVGKDCRRLVDRAREDGIKIPVEVALYIAHELADALAYAHRVKLPGGEVGLIHRDVSPTNVIVSYEGQVTLIDFGLAKHATAAGKTETGVVIGKVAYMAPEQCLGDSVDTRADIYSVGAVLYELLTGKRLREVEDLERLADIVRQPVTTFPTMVRPDVPPEVDAVLRKTLAVDRNDRYTHAEGLRNDLAAVLTEIEPRMSRDLVAGFLRKLFPAEHRAETEQAHIAETESAPAAPQSALTTAANRGGRPDTGKTQAMPVIPPGTLGSGADDTLVSPGPKAKFDARGETVVAEDPMAAWIDEQKAEPKASSAPATAPAPAAKAAGVRWLMVVLLSILCLLGGFAIRHLLLPNFGQTTERSRIERAAVAPDQGPARGAPPAMRPKAQRPPPRRARPRPAPGPTLAELKQQAEAALKTRLVKLAEADLRARGVRVSDLPALPRLAAKYAPVAAALRGDDLGRAVGALADFRGALDSRRFRCKKLRQAKYQWCRKRIRDIRKAAPDRRKDRKAFLAKHGHAALKARLRELRKRAHDDKLTCAEQSLAYQKLIPDLLRVLKEAGVPESKWKETKRRHRKKRDKDEKSD